MGCAARSSIGSSALERRFLAGGQASRGRRDAIDRDGARRAVSARRAAGAQAGVRRHFSRDTAERCSSRCSRRRGRMRASLVGGSADARRRRRRPRRRRCDRRPPEDDRRRDRRADNAAAHRRARPRSSRGGILVVATLRHRSPVADGDATSAPPTRPTRSRAAFKISNILQNLFGEGVLSASFIPVYAPLVAAEDRGGGRPRGGRGRRAAGARGVGRSCSSASSRRRCSFRSSRQGFDGREARADDPPHADSVSRAPGIFVISAWCLGILNSHRKFFLSVLRAGALERRDDRRAARGPVRGSTRRDLAVTLGVGIGRRRGAAVPRAGADDAAASCGIFGSRWTTSRRTSARVVEELRAGVRQPRRRADQQLHRQLARVVSARAAWSRRSATRRRSSCCR